ncbi:MAG: hypothetical protein NT118_09150 [Lentisphaerae bacterium]|nr:hypothetical protein [Lentisphaerota bacterium]
MRSGEKDGADGLTARLDNCVNGAKGGRGQRGFREGMGDFAIPFGKLKKLFDISVKKINPRKIAKYLHEMNPQMVADEIDNLKSKYQSGEYSQQCLEESVKSGLALRSYIKENQLGAFTYNFLAIDQYCTKK